MSLRVMARRGPRAQPQAIQSLFDFCCVRKAAEQALGRGMIKAGVAPFTSTAARWRPSMGLEFAAATLAKVNQGGCSTMGATRMAPAPGARLSCRSWGIKERLTLEKTAVGFYLSGHLFDEVATEVRRFVRTQIDELLDSREPQVLAGIISDFRVINGQRGKLGLFKLDDKSAVIEASADESLLNTYRNQLKKTGCRVWAFQLNHFRRSRVKCHRCGTCRARCRLAIFARHGGSKRQIPMLSVVPGVKRGRGRLFTACCVRMGGRLHADTPAVAIHCADCAVLSHRRSACSVVGAGWHRDRHCGLRVEPVRQTESAAHGLKKPGQQPISLTAAPHRGR